MTANPVPTTSLSDVIRRVEEHSRQYDDAARRYDRHHIQQLEAKQPSAWDERAAEERLNAADLRSLLEIIKIAGGDAAQDVLAERRRQVEIEGWTYEHDDQHDDGSLGRAAACYAACNNRLAVMGPAGLVHIWPWAPEWWKPKDPRRNLVRAAALILAEIERLDRTATGARTSQP